MVSGDLIQGVRLGTPNFAEHLAQQYAIAESFLIELSDRFLGGNRAAVVIVPGNHDVDWNTARAAMTLVPEAEVPSNLARELFTDTSSYRWNWSGRELYRISAPDIYPRRLDAFWTFFERFYRAVPGLLRVQRDADANLFALNNGTIGIAAFNSCHRNDCYALHGYIPPEVVARTHLDLTTPPHNFDLLIAVWHHSVEGPPHRTDYMDIEIVRGMIGRGFRLGLYGHQHHAQANPQEIYLPDRERMVIVSAESLCAGASELPTGVSRQYNVLEIADDFRSARVHVRQMSIANLFGRAALNAFGGRSFVQLEWDPRKDQAGRPIDAAAQRIRAAVEEAEVTFKSGNPGGALDLLITHSQALDPFGRRLLLQAAAAARNWPVLLEETNPPSSIEQLVMRISALVGTRDFDGARSALAAFAGTLNLDQGTETELRARISSEEAIRR